MGALGRTLAAASLLLTGALVPAATAGAGTLYAGAANNFGEYEAAPFEANDVTLTYDGSQYTITDPAGINVLPYNTYDNPSPFEPYPPFCTSVDATTARCPGSIGAWSIQLAAYRSDDLAGRGPDAVPNSFRWSGPAPPTANLMQYDSFLTVDGGAGPDTLVGSPLDDTLTPASQPPVGSGPNVVQAGGGDDTVRGEEGPDEIHGGPGNDYIYGAGGPDKIFGDDGKDFIRGDDGDDVLRGGAGPDNLNGLYGQDKVYGEAGDDAVEGGPGDDLSDGGPGNDGVSSSFHGSGCPGGRDTFVGGPGADSIYDFCGRPIFVLRDRTRDKVSCGSASRPVSAARDRTDRFTGGRCKRFNASRRR